jgi:hypothetical protein
VDAPPGVVLQVPHLTAKLSYFFLQYRHASGIIYLSAIPRIGKLVYS